MSDVRAAGKSANRKKNPIMQAKFAKFWEADDIFLIYKNNPPYAWHTIYLANSCFVP